MKEFIKRRLNTLLEGRIITESNDLELSKNDINRYLKVALSSAYDNKNFAYESLLNLVNRLKKLPNILTLYRVVFLKSKNQLNTNALGSFYSLSKNDLLSSHSTKPHSGHTGTAYIITVKAPKSLVDFDETILTRMQFPNEKEITLKNQGRGATLLSIEPMPEEEEDIDDDDLIAYSEFNEFD